MQDNHYYKYLSHKLLRTFYVVAQEQSITQAAQRLFITQPTVSLQIQSLERELSHTLFERHGPKITLTTEGHKLYELVQPIIMRLESLKPAFEDSLNDIEHGELNIAAGQTTSLYILPKFIKKFKALHPNIKVRLHNVTGAKLIKLVKSDKVDIAIGSLAEIPAGVAYEPFVSYSASLITAKGHPLAKKKKINLKDVAAHKLVMPPRSFDIWRTIDSVFNKHKLKYFVGVETGGWEIVKKYVELDLGISVINDASITGEEDIEVVSMRHCFSAKDYGLISRKAKFFSPQCKEFIKCFDVVEHIQENED